MTASRAAVWGLLGALCLTMTAAAQPPASAPSAGGGPAPAVTTAPGAPAGEPAAPQGIEPQAQTVLRKMAEHLVNQAHFEFRADIVFDEPGPAGQKLQLSNGFRLAVRRPNALAGEVVGDTAHKRFWYNGKQLAVLEPTTKMYSIVEVPSQLDAMLDHMMETYGWTVPLADLLVSDVYDSLTRGAINGHYVGLHRVGDTRCHHLAFTLDAIDWQIWIEDSPQPWPRKFLITYKDQPGEPQYGAVLTQWETTRHDDKFFAFELPGDAVRIEMMPTPAEPEDPAPAAP